MSALNQLYKAYKDRVEFFVVYIREAHAADSRRPDRRLSINEPRTFAERLGVAQTCRRDLGLQLPMLIDDIQNGTDAAYSGWPDRLFLVGTDGKIAFRGDRGPRGFQPDELEAAIKKTLGAKPKKKMKYTKEELDAIRERLKKRRKKSLRENE